MNTKLLRQINPEHLVSNLIGIEREGLRVKPTGCIATTPHPAAFGSPLTHPTITTDFAESLVEVVTPPVSGAQNAENLLEDSLHFVYAGLENNENFWPTSMPCIIRGQSEINIARYGSSHSAKMKEIYRQGLANRYGKAMQVVAGIHFNYSFSDEFWNHYHQLKQSTIDLQEFKNQEYMGLVRNVLRYGWILYYYFGASGSVCKSFLNNYHNHTLVEFDENTLYHPHATSLRMGDIGYQNTREDEAGVKANYNSICQYAHSLQAAMQTPFAGYSGFSEKLYNYGQLSRNILQIENEYYASIRPKPKPEAGIMPSVSLLDNGIEYIELRGLDINPLSTTGITTEQIMFLESFLLFCLTKESPPICSKEQVDIDTNNLNVAHFGLDRTIHLCIEGQKRNIVDVIAEVSAGVQDSSAIFGEKHQQAVEKIIHAQPLSQTILQQMKDNTQGFHSFSIEKAKHYQEYFRTKEKNTQYFELLAQQATDSTAKALEIERTDEGSFDEFLENYFSQI